MWNLSVPWFELVIRATTVFLVLFFMFKIWGKKQKDTGSADDRVQ